jgi:hypothetical protein
MKRAVCWTLVVLLAGSAAASPAAAQGASVPPVLTPDRLEKFRQQLADESQQGPSGEALNEIAKKAGYKTFGEVVKRIPVDDVSTFVGAASGGDSAGARQALEKGILKVLVAEGAGAGTAAVVGSSVLPPVAIGILASVATGMVYDYVVESNEAALKEEIGRKLDEMKSRRDMSASERENYQFWINAAQFDLTMLRGDAVMINFEIDQLARGVRAGKLSSAAYEAEYAKLKARYQGVVKEYAEALQRLRRVSGDRIAYLQRTLQGLRDEHRALKEQLDASGGTDAATSVMMSQIYKEYLQVKKELDALNRK